MRRTDKEITDINKILAVISECKVCRLGLISGGRPYVVPLNFGYEYCGGRLILYFHSALDGKKIDALAENNNACFETDCAHALVPAATPCGHGYRYKSVIGFGKAYFITDEAEKVYALNSIMRHQTGKAPIADFGFAALSRTAVFKVIAESFTGKES